VDRFPEAQLWQHVWAVIPLALIARGACRLSGVGRARHGLCGRRCLWFIWRRAAESPVRGLVRGIEANS